MNDQIRTQEETGTVVCVYAEQYGNLKFLHEVQMINLKESFKLELDELYQELKEAFISKQLLEYHRSQYDKKLKLNGIEPHEIAKSDNELPEILFASIMRSFSENTNTNNQFYKDTYLDAKELISKYYTRYFEIKLLTQKLKEEQSKELNELAQEIKDDGIAFYLIPRLYKNARELLKVKDESKREFSFYREMRDIIEDKMISNMERIRKEMLIDYKAKIEVQITRKESIERIEYIETQIDLEKFDILKEEWTNSEDRYFAAAVKEQTEKLKRTFKYYKEQNTDFKLSKDENIKILMDIPGIRLKKNHKYLIKN